MEDWQIEKLEDIVQELYDMAKQHKRECGECGDWAAIDDAAEILYGLVWEYKPKVTDPMTILKQRIEAEL